MKIFLSALLGFALGAITIGWWLQAHSAKEKTEETEHEHEPASRVQHGTNGEVIVKLDASTRERMGLRVAQVSGVSLSREVRGSGRVLDSALLSTVVADIQAGTVALEVSGRDYHRLKLLHDQDQNVSARALELADAAMRRDRILLEAAKLRLLTGWGAAMADHPDLPGMAARLARQDSALAQISIPLGDPAPGSPAVGRLTVAGREFEPLKSEFIGPSPSTDPQTQGPGYLFLVSSNSLRPGTPIVAWLEVSGEKVSGVLVPASAVLRHSGELFVYLQAAENSFMRVAVELHRTSEGGWIVREGLTAGSEIVTVGAQQLLSEELKGRGGEE